MDKQLIISVGREFGSAGRLIGEELAKRFDLPFYDHNLLDDVAKDLNVSGDTLIKYDEKPKSKLLSRTVRGHSSSMYENVANLQFDFLKKKAASGESFVIVGRCAETVLKEYKGLISIFVLSDRESKAERIKELYHLNQEDALRLMDRKDSKRKAYHNSHCSGKWGDARNYDLCINSCRLGIDKTVDMLENYIRERMTLNEK